MIVLRYPDPILRIVLRYRNSILRIELRYRDSILRIILRYRDSILRIQFIEEIGPEYKNNSVFLPVFAWKQKGGVIFFLFWTDYLLN